MTLLTEKRLSLPQLAQREGKSAATVCRWASQGVRGVVLETFCIGRDRHTTEEAWERFVERTTEAATV